MKAQFYKLLLIISTLIITPHVLADVDASLTTGNGDLVQVDAIISDRLIDQFIIDTGASFVIIGNGTYQFMLQQKIPMVALESVRANIGDGSVITLLQFRIHSIRVGSCKIRNIEIAVNPTDDTNIIGWPFLHKIQPFTIDRTKMVMTGAKCEGDS